MSKSEPKQVIIIRKDLKMRPGKIAAQAAHASLAAIMNEAIFTKKPNQKKLIISLEIDDPSAMIWFNQRFKKVSLKVNNEKELIDLYEKAKENNLPCSLIRDAGDTVFNGNPTFTAVAIGPADSDRIDQITRNLSLL